MKLDASYRSICLLRRLILASLLAGPLLFVPLHGEAEAQQNVQPDVIEGTVTGASGPEAGVWVIAETKDLPTKFAKIVVTDDQGGYVLPELPKANYEVWVRGYGLADSPKLKAAPGSRLDLKAVAAPNDAEAAKYYPAQYWYS